MKSWSILDLKNLFSNSLSLRINFDIVVLSWLIQFKEFLILNRTSLLIVAYPYPKSFQSSHSFLYIFSLAFIFFAAHFLKECVNNIILCSFFRYLTHANYWLYITFHTHLFRLLTKCVFTCILFVVTRSAFSRSLPREFISINKKFITKLRPANSKHLLSIDFNSTWACLAWKIQVNQGVTVEG